MAKRDTIISVTDIRSGHRATIRVPFATLQDALREKYGRHGRPVTAVDAARKHICIQAKQALAKKGRHQRWLSWEDIADSVRSSDQVPAQGTPDDAPVSLAYRALHPEPVADDDSLDEPETSSGHVQLTLFAN